MDGEKQEKSPVEVRKSQVNYAGRKISWSVYEGHDEFGEPNGIKTMSVTLIEASKADDLLMSARVFMNHGEPMVSFISDNSIMIYCDYVNIKIKSTDKDGNSKTTSQQLTPHYSGGWSYLYLVPSEELISDLIQGNDIIMNIETNTGYSSIYPISSRGFKAALQIISK